MNRQSLNKTLTRLETALARQQPAVMVVTLRDGTQETADAASIWDYFKDPVKRKQVETIRASRDDYSELAGVVEILCKS